MASHFKDGTLPGARWQFYLQFLIHSIFVRVFFSLSQFVFWPTRAHQQSESIFLHRLANAFCHSYTRYISIATRPL